MSDAVRIVERDGDAWVDTRTLNQVIIDAVTEELARQGKTRAWLAERCEVTPAELDEVLGDRKPMLVEWAFELADTLGHRASALYWPERSAASRANSGEPS